MAAITVGGRGAALSSAAVFTVANGLAAVSIDSSALANLSNSSKHPPRPSPESSPPKSETAAADLESARAALLVLLNKLLLAGSVRRPHLPQLIAGALCDPSGSIDVSALAAVATKEESPVLDGFASAAAIGAVALVDCSSAALAPVLDAVAALSCEAVGAGVAQFDCPDSGDGFSKKDVTDVGSDLRDLLLGSKFVAAGRDSRRAVAEVPSFHGSFRSGARSVHKSARVELNSKAWVDPVELLGAVSQLVIAIKAVGEMSFERCKLVVEAIDGALQSQVRDLFDKHCDDAIERIRSIYTKVFVQFDNASAPLLEIYASLDLLRSLLAWEAALALFFLELNSDDYGNGENAGVGDEKDDNPKKKKKKKSKVLGKGTASIRAFFKERLGTVFDGKPDVLIDWAKKLYEQMNPKNEFLDSFVKLIGDIVGSNEARRLPKIPKGTRDFTREQMAVRERAYGIIVNVFKRHGAVALDTPTFELRETLMGKYGEDSKLIYDLADQGGEICSLRYDLTVPFARFLAMNKITSYKRYHIAKVFRRDNPSKGRYREFCQCDFDIAGKCNVMEYDFEVIKVLTELLDELKLGDYEIKLNHRKLLDGMLDLCGVPASKFRTVCSSIDKLDKMSFEMVKDELVKKKGLSVETVEKIGTFVKKKGRPSDILSELKQYGSQFVEALGELELLFLALEKSRCIDKVVFDLSLARGLDYYTGVIFEAVFKGSTQVGSIAAGGRYDNLVKQFSAQIDAPAVGVSLGIERVLTIMEEQLTGDSQAIRPTETQVLVGVMGKASKDLLGPTIELITDLWDANLKAEFAFGTRFSKHVDYAKAWRIPFVVLVGEEEFRQGTAKVREIATKDERVVRRDQLVSELRQGLNINNFVRHVVV